MQNTTYRRRLKCPSPGQTVIRFHDDIDTLLFFTFFVISREAVLLNKSGRHVTSKSPSGIYR